MTFDEAVRQYADLRARVQAGWLTQEQFAAAVSQLRVQDQRGVWWQLHPNGSWLYWDGRAWQAPLAQPAPSAAPAAPPRPAAARPRPASAPPRGRPVARPRPVAPTARAAGDDRRKPLAQRSQHWFNTASIAGGGIAGVLWFLYSSVRSAQEGLDLLTPLIMVLLPIAIAALRAPIDRLLAVLAPVRSKVPRGVLIGAGLMAPFVVAWMLYGTYTEYPYLRVSTVLGTLTSYAIIRTPVTSPKAPPAATRRAGGAR